MLKSATVYGLFDCCPQNRSSQVDEDLAANAERLGQLLRSQLQAIRSPRIQQARSHPAFCGRRQATDKAVCALLCLDLHSLLHAGRGSMLIGLLTSALA